MSSRRLLNHDGEDKCVDEKLLSRVFHARSHVSLIGPYLWLFGTRSQSIRSRTNRKLQENRYSA